MINLFYDKSTVQTAIIESPNWKSIKDMLQDNVNQTISYYNTNIRSVKSNHILARLLNSISIPKNISIDRYYFYIDELTEKISTSFNFTSPVSKGALFRGIFYGANNPEFILSVNDYFDIGNAHRNWKTIQSVKVLSHPKNDLLLMLPNGHMYNSETDLTIISINIPLLAIQYRAFYLNEIKNNSLVIKGVNQFIGTYVLPNMLYSQTEFILYNRIYNKYKDIPTNDISNTKHPFALINYTNLLDKEIDRIIYNLKRTSKDYNSVFNNIPSIYNNAIIDSLLLPNMAKTRQVSWLLLISRLKTIDLLIMIAEKDILNKNQTIISRLVQQLNSSSGLKLLKEILPIDVYEPLEIISKKIINISNKTVGN